MEVEIDLVYKAIDGDQDAFGSLIKTYYEEIYQIAFGITGSPLDAEDLAQETFIKAYTSISQLRNPDRFKIWLRKIAQNICMDWLRSNMQQNLPIDDLSNDTQLTFPSADERLIREDFEEALTLALSSLSKEDVGILRLFYIYGFDYSQIMRVSGLSYSALTSRLHRIRKRIKTITGDYILTTKAESAFTILSGGAKYMKIGLGFSDSVLSTIRTVEYAQPTETDRQFLCGINLDCSREYGSRLIATDGKRLAIAQLTSDKAEENLSIIIPTGELVVLMEALERENAPVSVEQIDDSLAAFYIGDSKRLIKLYSEKYVNYKDIIPKDYTDSIMIERKSALDLMEKFIEPSKAIAQCDWVQRGDMVYVSRTTNIFEVWHTDKKAARLCHELLKFILNSTSSEEIGKNILAHISRDEYQRLFDELEEHKERPAPSNPEGQLEILESTGESEFTSRFNGRFLFDALKVMVGDTITIHYKMEKKPTLDAIATQRPILLRDDTENMHIFMPMGV